MSSYTPSSITSFAASLSSLRFASSSTLPAHSTSVTPYAIGVFSLAIVLSTAFLLWGLLLLLHLCCRCHPPCLATPGLKPHNKTRRLTAIRLLFGIGTLLGIASATVFIVKGIAPLKAALDEIPSSVNDIETAINVMLSSFNSTTTALAAAVAKADTLLPQALLCDFSIAGTFPVAGLPLPATVANAVPSIFQSVVAIGAPQRRVI